MDQQCIFKVQPEPCPQRTCPGDEIILNPGVGQTACGYRQTQSVCGTTYTNSDPRLLNAAGPTRLTLDRPPLTSHTPLRTLVTDRSLDRYGQGYKGYADVNAGQVMYYIDRSIEDALFPPLFERDATVVGSVYTDPMGNSKPQYDRVVAYDDPFSRPNQTDGYGLSWIKDSQDHRQDLLSRQMHRRNEQRYAPRWTQ